MSIGSAWRIGEQSGRVKVDVRFEDGSRAYGTLPINWQPAKSRDIENAVITIAQLVKDGRTLKEAIEALYGKNKIAPEAVIAPSKKALLDTWEAFGKYKVATTGKVKEKTWNTGYKKSEKRLIEVADAKDAKELLRRAAEIWPPGIRQRQETIQHLAAMLRWGVEEGMLDDRRWEPPKEGSKWIQDTVGDKPPGEKKKRGVDVAVALTDKEILMLLEALEKNREADAAKRWILALRLIATYGLRPTEVQFLEVRTDPITNERYMACSYEKRSGSGKTEERDLLAVHPEWEKLWGLLDAVASPSYKDDLPPFGEVLLRLADGFLLNPHTTSKKDYH